MNAGAEFKGFGASVLRKEDQRFITGKGRYTDDMQLPGQTWACIVRAPYAHARILGFDTDAAASHPGVVGVFTGQDYAASGLGNLMDGWLTVSRDGTPCRIAPRPALAATEVHYAGEPVAVVIAESRQAARDAAELVFVDYQDLPAMVGLRQAQGEGALQLHEIAPGNQAFDWEAGDEAATEAAFASATHRVGLDFSNSRLIPNAMEPRASNASYDSGSGQFTLHMTTQNPFGVRIQLAAVIGFGPDSSIRVVSEDVGGGFGSKAPLYPEEIIVMWAARQLQRPVKWTAERGEAFLADAHGRDHLTHAELAFDDEHRIVGLRFNTIANLGAYISTSGSLVPTVMYALIATGQYAIPSAYGRVQGIYTNTAPVDAYRGAGRPEAAYMIERLMDHAARQLGTDPATLRRKNFVSAFPYRSAFGLEYNSGNYPALLDQALALMNHDQFAQRRAESEARGMKRGFGLSCYIEIAGFGPSQILGKLGAPGGVWESAEVRVNVTGTVEVITGCHSHGQSHETVYAQLVSSELGVPFEQITIIHGDTAKGAYGAGTSGSRSSVGMSAVHGACQKIIAKGKRIVAALHGLHAEEITFSDGVFTAGAVSVSFLEVAGAAYAGHHFPTDEIEPGWQALHFFDPQNFTYPTGCYACEVEIDPETGVTRIVDFAAVDDFGRIANPMIVEGQVHGGVVQGIGQALYEHCEYDPESGQLMTGSYMDYCLPRADDLPRFKLGFVETPCPGSPTGMKGCGEAGTIGATPAVINAVLDALGIDDIDMPATPHRVWQAIQRASADQGGL